MIKTMVVANRLALVALMALAGTGAANAQQPPTRMPARRLPPAEVQRLFDAYTLMQAQDALKLSDSQYGQFVTRMKALQETRRRNQRTRAELLRELARLADGGAGTEAALRQQLQALGDHDARAAADLQKAYFAVDEVLEPTQQARFRLFEESMERKKFDLLTRARQRARGRLKPDP